MKRNWIVKDICVFTGNSGGREKKCSGSLRRSRGHGKEFLVSMIMNHRSMTSPQQPVDRNWRHRGEKGQNRCRETGWRMHLRSSRFKTCNSGVYTCNLIFLSMVEPNFPPKSPFQLNISVAFSFKSGQFGFKHWQLNIKDCPPLSSPSLIPRKKLSFLGVYLLSWLLDLTARHLDLGHHAMVYPPMSMVLLQFLIPHSMCSAFSSTEPHWDFHAQPYPEWQGTLICLCHPEGLLSDPPAYSPHLQPLPSHCLHAYETSWWVFSTPQLNPGKPSNGIFCLESHKLFWGFWWCLISQHIIGNPFSCNLYLPNSSHFPFALPGESVAGTSMAIPSGGDAAFWIWGMVYSQA